MTFKSLVTQGLNTIRDVGGETVTYADGSGTVTLTAAISRTNFDVVDNEGMVERYEMRDFLVVASDLVIGGSTVTPSRGHQITWESSTFEGMAPGKEPVCSFVDQHNHMYRVHTKRTA